jgi:hypothetical protein
MSRLLSFFWSVERRNVNTAQPKLSTNRIGLEDGNYFRVSLPTFNKAARALGAEIEIKLSA